LDEKGLHFDPARPSALEDLLETRVFSREDKLRARALRQSILSARLSKYNPEGSGGPLAGIPAGRRVLLVPGQVEDDDSVVLGGAGIFTNAELVRAVRAAHPEAYLVYRPHPDVVSGNRRGALPPEAVELIDQVVSGQTLDSCLAAVQEVHTLTSLVGFEGLLRGLSVSTYGQPFYAGWGLTEDRVPVPRRTRQLDIDDLVLGVLLVYPRYYSFRVGAFVTAEEVVFDLVRSRAVDRAIPLESRWPLRQLRKVWGWSQEVRRAF
jgi:capsular polysaccharide export protein